MSFDLETLYALLPAVYRIRDAEQNGELKAFLSVIAEQIGLLEEDLAQLYDDQFIETCADWAVPYIGDLIGFRPLQGATPRIRTPRAEVANTIGYRRRKGTAAMLEQLARDVTDWPARAVEFFQLLSTTQYLNHLRPTNLATPDLRKWEMLERLGTPFDSFAHTAEVRRIASKRGKFNIPNIGLFLYRIQSYSLTDSPAFSVGPRRFLFSPLGNNTPLMNRVVSEDQITHLAEPENVPMSISRRMADAYLGRFYGRENSFQITVDGNPVPAGRIAICDLSDISATDWANKPSGGTIAIDPVLGRFYLPRKSNTGDVRVSFYYGFSADMGGGEYDRSATFDDLLRPVIHVPADQPTLQGGLNAVLGGGVAQVDGSGRYAETLSLNATAGSRIEVRAASGSRPTVVLTGDFAITGGADSEITLNGLLLTGGTLTISGAVRAVNLRHCTLVPGLALNVDGSPQSPGKPSLIVKSPGVQVTIEKSIVGAIFSHPDAQIHIVDSIVDATAEDGIAYAALDGASAGGILEIETSTVIGQVRTAQMTLAENTLFFASANLGEPPVAAERRQVGCVRFCYVPLTAQVPRRYQCQPKSEDDAVRVRPQFTSLRYGDAGYAQLLERTPSEIRTGAEDEAEIGAFHFLQQPQRESNLRVRLEEYLRFSLEAGIFYAS